MIDSYDYGMQYNLSLDYNGEDKLMMDSLMFYYGFSDNQGLLKFLVSKTFNEFTGKIAMKRNALSRFKHQNKSSDSDTQSSV